MMMAARRPCARGGKGHHFGNSRDRAAMATRLPLRWKSVRADDLMLTSGGSTCPRQGRCTVARSFLDFLYVFNDLRGSGPPLNNIGVPYYIITHVQYKLRRVPIVYPDTWSSAARTRQTNCARSKGWQRLPSTWICPTVTRASRFDDAQCARARRRCRVGSQCVREAALGFRL